MFLSAVVDLRARMFIIAWQHRQLLGDASLFVCRGRLSLWLLRSCLENSDVIIKIENRKYQTWLYELA